ncbi:TonB family protein [Hyphomicrobiales bacterium]|nr:TonB family protein [Hyphomicrobiales bacterium]
MNKNLTIAFLVGVVITLLVVNYLPKFDIEIKVAEKDEPLKIGELQKVELSQPIPEITADEFLLQNYPDTRISYNQQIEPSVINNQEPKNTKNGRRITKKTSRTQTMSRIVGTEFIKAQEALSEEQGDKALKILDNLLRNPDLRDFEKATIIRLKGYIYVGKEDYLQSMFFLKEAFSYKVLEPQAQLDLQFGIAQLYLAIDQWGNGLYELLDWFDDAEAIGYPPGPSAHALLSQIFLYLASSTEKGSLVEKQFYKKAKPHAEEVLLNSSEPRENWIQIYLSILLFDDRYEEARPVLEKLFQKFPGKPIYKRQLAALYNQLGINYGLIPASKETFDKTLITHDFQHPQFGIFSASTDADVLPILKVPPQYPRRATQRGIEGWVLLEFTVTETGAVINERVVDADPPGIFNRSALAMIKKWKYKPKIKKGKAVQLEGVRHSIIYELEYKK